MSMSGYGEGGAVNAPVIRLKQANRAAPAARDMGRYFMVKKFLLLAAMGGLIFATGLAPADAAPRRATGGTEAAASSGQRSQTTRNGSASQGQKANRQSRNSTKANRNRAPRNGAAAG